jgi:hypothetical protein
VGNIQKVFVMIRGLIQTVNSKKPESARPENFTEVSNALSALRHEPWLSFCQEVERWCDIQREAAEWRQAYIEDGKVISRRSMAFKRYVDSKQIPTDLTPYAAQYWSIAPEEFYCEAFAIWRVDPGALALHSQVLSDYFTQNLHLSDS